MNFADSPAPSTFRLAKFFFFSGILLIAQTSWRPFLSITLSDWCFLASVLFLLPAVLEPGKIKVPFPKYVWIALALIVVGGLLSTPFARSPLSSFSSVTKLFYLVGIWFLVGAVFLHNNEDIQKAMVFWCLSAGVTSAAAAAQMIWGDIIPGTSPNWGRMTGMAEHVNDLGVITSISLVPALYLSTCKGNRARITLAFWFLACLIAGGLVWSGSISGVLAAATGLFIWVLGKKMGWRDVLVLCIGGGSIVFLVSIVAVETTDTPKTVVAKAGKTEVAKVETGEGVTDPRKAEVAKVETEKAEVAKVGTGEAVTDPGKAEVAKVETGKPEVAKVETEKAEVGKGAGRKIEGGETNLAKTERAMTAKEKAQKELLERAKTYRVKSGDPPMLVTRLVQLKEKALRFDTLQFRMTDFQMAWESISQNIMVGVGMGPSNGKTDTGRLVHNMFFVYWYEGGLLAFLGILLLVGAIAKSGFTILNFSNWPPRPLSVSLVSAYSAFLVLALGQPIYYKRVAWFPALLILSLYSIYKAKR